MNSCCLLLHYEIEFYILNNTNTRHQQYHHQPMDELSAHFNLHVRLKRKRKEQQPSAETQIISSALGIRTETSNLSLGQSLISDFDISVVSLETDYGKDKDTKNISTKRYALFTDDLIYSWNNISVTTSEPIFKPQVLWHEIIDEESVQGSRSKPVCGVAYGGEILAVLGGSGVGKSTLLNILSFRHSSRLLVDGDRCINGIMIDHRILHEISAYMQEKDVFPPYVTVREHLIFNAVLRTKHESTYSERVQTVDRTLRDFGLWEVRNNHIGLVKDNGIDHVSRKFLALAAELLSDPRILFCECPTSGMDCAGTHSIMSELQRFTSKGNLVISTFVSPSTETFHMFDRICLMSMGGIAFHGTPLEATEYWGELGFIAPKHHNPLDFLVSTLVIDPDNEEECRYRSEMIIAGFEMSRFYTKMKEDANLRHWKTASMARLEKRFFKDALRYKTNWCTQFVCCCRREMSINLRSKFPYYGRLLISVVAALIYGSIFWQQPVNDYGVQSSAAFFASVMIVTLMGACGFAAMSLGRDFEVLVRENYKRLYRTSCYYVAKNLCDLPICLLCPVVFVAITNYMVGLGGILSKPVRYACITLLAATFSSSGLGYFFLGLTGDVVAALGILTTDIIHYMIFSGLIINTQTSLSFIGFLHNISISYQVMENLMITQYRETVIKPVNASLVHFDDGDGVFNFYRYDKSDLWQNYTVMFAIFVGFRFVALVPLLIRLYLHRRFYPDV